ncbi:MAG TPA: CoA transferase [Rhizomicrobium sp.]|nr:CoA transferase [Rhizomicrobium sp.]
MSDKKGPLAKGPLDGVRVLDLTEFIFGPYATQTLGDFGADVIKVENPGGDRQRYGSKHAKSEDMSALFMTMNRNKRSVVLDLKSDEGREKLRALIPTANVFIHNVRADAMARLGFGYEEVAKINPHIVYVHCVGYGSGGPYAGRQAFDDLVQAASGAADLLPRVDGNEDMRLLPSFIADKVSSMHALSATLAALYHQKATGEGQFVEVPMFECFTHFMLIEHLYGETFEPPVSHMGHTPALAADRRPLKCKDGYICIQPVSRASSAKFMELGGIANAYESERFLSAPKGQRVGVYYAMQREAAMAHTVEEWMKLGDEHRIPIMRANGLDDVLDDPHLKAVDFFEMREHPTEGGWRTMKPPVKFSKTPASIRLAPPKPGQDNSTIVAP